MKKHIHVVGAVIVENGRILCAQRGGAKAQAYQWEFPGGKIEEGETPQEALKREIREEMNCTVEVGEWIETTVYEYDFGFVHLSTFYCTRIEGTPTLTEHAAIRWLPAGELSTLDWAPADIPSVHKIQMQTIRSVPLATSNQQN
ncbi:(deoxy)nucleoside triphosphate pyrophosphohydrolase [Saccharibacillus sp. CPCC 101409]|uniref:(deoxy)nucleoside triphosphate pyrophosphohydrolase n=1 Tax=Saccharibacillus sp. CPCC 101409 TaxID=3058041 RepID=UPI002673AAFB|nr:(deoxy)nucleoside triphosphate pyrophosphohydrolase [Saccharibacillus sp. CPCC 101409]MDO3408395.1 (deoxy)nucleoside triphosphate pyrophosphohydrolase [Saccharibacillus sp. CPCC 101409]